MGLGGRLDAVNIVDPDIAVITSIDLDHQDWLGDTREKIGFEKAGIFRPEIPVVVGDPNPPESVVEQAQQLRTVSYWQGKEFAGSSEGNHWQWTSESLSLSDLPLPKVPLQNVSTALCVLQLLDISPDLPQLHQVIAQTSLPGRQQIIQSRPTVMLDVAHNPQATRHLADVIGSREYDRLHLVVAMLADKDIKASLAPLQTLLGDWYLAPLNVPRGAGTEQIKPLLVGQQKVLDFGSVNDAYKAVLENAGENDLVVIFGSFYTVAEILEQTS